MPLVFKPGRKILILALLLVIPLQGVAAPLAHLMCSSPSGVEHVNAGDHHGGGDHAASHHPDDSAGNTGDSGNSHAGHSSCHQASPAIPSVSAAVIASALPIFEPVTFLFPSLFFPEQPQRPPLA